MDQKTELTPAAPKTPGEQRAEAAAALRHRRDAFLARHSGSTATASRPSSRPLTLEEAEADRDASIAAASVAGLDDVDRKAMTVFGYDAATARKYKEAFNG